MKTVAEHAIAIPSHLELPSALLVTKFLRADRGGLLRLDDARNLLRRSFELYRSTYDLRIHAWSFLPSRVDLVVGLPCEGTVKEALEKVFGYYTRRFNARYGKDGALFRTKFVKRLLVGQPAIAAAVERVSRMPETSRCRWEPGRECWSSAGFYRLGREDRILTPLPGVARPWGRRREEAGRMAASFEEPTAPEYAPGR